MQFNQEIKEETLEVQIDTSTASNRKENRQMGTRKNPKDFGREPNTIRNQSEMSYENENSNNMGFQ